MMKVKFFWMILMNLSCIIDKINSTTHSSSFVTSSTALTYRSVIQGNQGQNIHMSRSRYETASKAMSVGKKV